MKHKVIAHNSFSLAQDGGHSINLLKEWDNASFFVDGEEEKMIYMHNTLLGSSSMSGSGMSYPGISRMNTQHMYDAAQSTDDDREFSFNSVSKKST